MREKEDEENHCIIFTLNQKINAYTMNVDISIIKSNHLEILVSTFFLYNIFTYISPKKNYKHPKWTYTSLVRL